MYNVHCLPVTPESTLRYATVFPPNSFALSCCGVGECWCGRVLVWESVGNGRVLVWESVVGRVLVWESVVGV